ncbi:tetrahydromethanopterin S-methyltransferase subunit D [Candidatus Methanocrinis natronophilus]|uniref:Tetrahydromethanopterin S-methyltransferase subunit D n=1 Tax=Candidatus Methanocrinis natronophilus TaxID=3033396 RepID=A0ABT5X933_9EURY|nr:tetrahydromethanopterin S-methyltransferase subunit D [Candidatus Methanocrinis natronophilus]MDF0591197.1 tetrahydromethanopterin S-methyltransferase subunit D [Candidatus Methanocrinis natronophilus]
MSTFDATTLVYVFQIIIGGLLVGVGVHFVPVGGAPAAMAQATGVGTGTVQLATGSGLTGLISAGLMMSVAPDNMLLIVMSGAVGAMIMINVTMLVGNWSYVYAVGVPPVSGKVDYDPITKDPQPPYIAPGTVGHGVPTVSYVSGTIGGLMGGAGGSLIYYALMNINGISGLSAFFAIGIFVVNAVIASYNIQGTIEGFHDPKFKRLPKAIQSCFVATLIIGIFAVLIHGGV